jgi:hypothetical protein
VQKLWFYKLKFDGVPNAGFFQVVVVVVTSVVCLLRFVAQESIW